MKDHFGGKKNYDTWKNRQKLNFFKKKLASETLRKSLGV
jgi:hypothetical protein